MLLSRVVWGTSGVYEAEYNIIILRCKHLCDGLRPYGILRLNDDFRRSEDMMTGDIEAQVSLPNGTQIPLQGGKDCVADILTTLAGMAGRQRYRYHSPARKEPPSVPWGSEARSLAWRGGGVSWAPDLTRRLGEERPARAATVLSHVA
jgi:hypothetical protein